MQTIGTLRKSSSHNAVVPMNQYPKKSFLKLIFPRCGAAFPGKFAANAR
jgi:hypothetical protein